MKSGRSIFLDLFLYFIVNCFLLAVYDFFNILAIFIFTSYFSYNCYFVKVIFFFNC